MTIRTVNETFKKKNFFITGSTGFIGKVLLEKLLRSCETVGNIYLLMREKKGQTTDERLNHIINIPLFDKIRTKPELFDKLKIINGDIRMIGLGISDQDRQLLIDNINIIYHGAASVRFDDSLKESIILNTRSTREIVKLAIMMKQLNAFVHISTTYCNTDKKCVNEILYKSNCSWIDAIKLAENFDEYLLDIMAKKFMNPLPNTYTFSKQLAENVVEDLCQNRIPVIIFRPSIVISTAEEPFPGWIDNFNGPVALLVATGKGVLRSLYTNPKLIADYVPVDILAKALILAVWDKLNSSDNLSKIDVYNGSSSRYQSIDFGEMIEIGRYFQDELPLDNIAWYPDGGITNCWYYHYFRVLFFHLLPAFIIDLLLIIIGKKPILLKIQRKIYTANMALEYFIINQWEFKNDHTWSLQNKLLINDLEQFCYNENIDPFEYFKNAILGTRRYLLNEPDKNLVKAKLHSNRMWFLAKLWNGLWYLIIFWLIFFKFDIIGLVEKKYYDGYLYLTTP